MLVKELVTYEWLLRLYQDLNLIGADLHDKNIEDAIGRLKDIRDDVKKVIRDNG